MLQQIKEEVEEAEKEYKCLTKELQQIKRKVAKIEEICKCKERMRKKDKKEFLKLIGFIEVCQENDLECHGDPIVTVYNNTIIAIEEIAQRHGLYNEDDAINNVWYHRDVLFPKMKEYFDKMEE